ncbi:MAG: hypothetical protein QGF59_09390, partial [Pirellulaceae bacterium]|nr:hypothetical protein [Pirellulaceae bacterium]
MRDRTSLGLLLILAFAAGVACRPVSTSSGDYSAGSNPSARQGKPKVFVVNYPLEYFARRIGGELVDVE